MTRRPRVLLSVLVALLAPSAAAAQGELPDIPYERYALPNGLEVVLAPDAAASEVSATPFGQGLAWTPEGRARLDSLRMDSNAITRFDYTRYYRQTRRAGLELFLEAAADRLGGDAVLELTSEHADRHRRNVIAEIERQASGTWSWALRLALQAGTFGPQHPYGHHIYGSRAETGRVSADDLLRWHRAHVRPEYTTLIVVGGFDPAVARAAIERLFGPIPGGARPPAPDPVVPEVAPSAATELWELAGRFGASATFADPADCSRHGARSRSRSPTGRHSPATTP